jgi:CheY-like chemotaxis protein
MIVGGPTAYELSRRMDFAMSKPAQSPSGSNTPVLELSGIKVLVIEDESLIAMFIEDTLSDIGCESVAVASNLDDALTKVTEIQCDIVMLDVNLAGKETFKLAEILAEKNQPFIFSTGYGNAVIPTHLRHVPVLQKPFREIDLQEKLQTALTMNRP